MMRKPHSPQEYKKDLQPRVSLDVGAKHETDSLTMSEAPTEVEMRRRIKYGGPLTAAWGLFSEYCNNSTIHGVKYLGERRRPWMERAWWVIVFVLSIYGCSRLIWNVWNKWDQSPVIVSFAEKSTPVWQIPFPAVTICPETKSKREFLNYTEVYHLFRSENHNLTDEQIAKFEAVSQVCDAHLVADTKIGENTTDQRCTDYLKEIAPSAEEILFFCKWRNTPDTCEDLFTDMLTEEGFCYTFNALNSSDIYRESSMHDDFVYHTHNKTSEHWTLENGYSPEASLTPFPVRVLGAGARAGIFILLRLYEYDLDYICRGPVQGFKILLHTPGEIPQVSKQYFRVPLNQEVVVSVKPNMITTSDGLRDYSPNSERRQCFFNHERYLRYFKIYTQQNCELECLSNFTLSKCGCVKFSMPRDSQTPICGAANIWCYNEAEDQLLQREIKEGLQDSRLNVKGQTQCNCLPACTSIVYDAEISQADFDWESLFIAYKNPLDEFPGVQLARLSIFFKETQFITSKRSELYGPTDFLANCGGLLGLFMGVSLLSIVEIVYFCTIRLICNLRTRKSRKASINNPGIIVVTPTKVHASDLHATK